VTPYVAAPRAFDHRPSTPGDGDDRAYTSQTRLPATTAAHVGCLPVAHNISLDATAAVGENVRSLTSHTHTFFRIVFIQFFLPCPCEAVHLAAVTTTSNPFSPHRELFTLNAVVVTYPLPEPPPPPYFSTNFYRGTRHTHTTDAHNHNNNLYSLLTLKTWQRHITHPSSAAEDWCSFFFLQQ